MSILKDRSNWILVLLVLLLFLFSFLLYGNLTRRGKEGDNPVIGILTFKNKTVERKFDSEVIWDSVQSGVEIRNKDTIRSGDFSDATLILNDKTKIAINENSMIYLDFSDGMNLNFAYGSMSLEKSTGTGETLKIVSGDKTVEVKNSNLVMEKKNKEELNFQVKKGDAKIKVGKEEKVLKTNEKANISENKIDVEQVMIELQAPDEFFVASAREEFIPISFQWKSIGKLTNTRVELAYDSRFRKLVNSFPAKGNSLSTSIKAGNYYWRVSGFNSEKKEEVNSSFRKIKAISILSPVILNPKNNKKFTYTSVPPIVQFNWTKMEEVRNFKLEISNNPNFTEIIKSMTLSQSYAGIDNLKPGNYFARVIAEINMDGVKPEISKPINFSIVEMAEPPVPQLISPADDHSLNKMAFTKGKYYFQWKDSSEYQSYLWELSSDPNFSTTIKKENVNANLYKPNFPLEVGNYYWRVWGITREGKQGKQSKSFSFRIKSIDRLDLKSPADNSRFELDDSQISFTWNRVDLDPNFLLEISSDSRFSQIVHSRKTNSYQETIHLKNAGKYFWRVKLLDETEKIIVTSPVHDLEILDMVDPEILFPREKEKVDMAKKDYLEFRWKSDSDVEYYELDFYSDPKNPLAKLKTKKTRYLFKELDKLDEGEFHFSIQSFSNSKSGKPIVSKKIKSNFTIYLSEKPQAPSVKSAKKIFVE